MLDPEELYRLDPDLPELGSPVLLCSLDGFVDAGGVSSLLRDHLAGGPDSRVLATFDVDGLLDYRSRRPTMLYMEDHWESYDTPELTLRATQDAAGVPYLLLTGPEPDYQWERFVIAVRGLIERLGVRLTVGFHGIPMAVPHSRPIGMTAHASRKELIEGYEPWVASVQVPGSASHLLEHRRAQAGEDAMGFAVHVPHYLAQAAYPPAAEALLRAVSRASGLALPLGSLEEAAREAQRSVATLVEQSDELAEMVRTLEAQYDAVVADRGASLTEAGGLPTGDELGAELERFLAEQARRRDDPR